MAARWSITLDKRSHALIQRHRRILPERDVRAGGRAAVREVLRLAQRNTVRTITKTTPLKRAAFIGRKGQKRFSGVKMYAGVNGWFWVVVRDFVLHRTGQVTQVIKNRRVRAEGGRLLRRRVIPAKNAFAINKAAYTRTGGKLKSVRLQSYGKIKRAFVIGTASASRKAPIILHAAMVKQFSKYLRRLKP